MAKIKITMSRSQIIVNTKLFKAEQINHKELTVFSNTFLKGFMRPVPEDAKTIDYVGSDGYPLGQLLKAGMDVDTYFLVIAQVLEAIKTVRQNDLDLQNLILDADTIFFNPKTKELSFIYQPIINSSSNSNIFAQTMIFVQELIFMTLFKEGEDKKDVLSFTQAVKKMQPCTLARIEKVLKYTYPFASSQMQNQALGESPVNNGIDEKSQGVYLKPIHVQFPRGVDMPYPYLIRKKNKEQIPLNKPVFRLGKEKSYVDYFVHDNNAVSRSHADFITRDNRCFILDHNSTNKTYLNGIGIEPHSEVELTDNMIISLGDEEFIFYIG